MDSIQKSIMNYCCGGDQPILFDEKTSTGVSEGLGLVGLAIRNKGEKKNSDDDIIKAMDNGAAKFYKKLSSKAWIPDDWTGKIRTMTLINKKAIKNDIFIWFDKKYMNKGRDPYWADLKQISGNNRNFYTMYAPIYSSLVSTLVTEMKKTDISTFDDITLITTIITVNNGRMISATQSNRYYHKITDFDEAKDRFIIEFIEKDYKK